MAQQDKKERGVVIHLDKKTYRWEDAVITGAQLRALPEPDISAEYELKQQVPGGDDKTITNGEEVVVKPGLHFFSIPTNINAGA